MLASGFRVHGRHLVATLLSNSLPTSRLGLVISRKLGKAVIRNRVRRRLREIFRRRLRTELDGVEPADLVIRALPSAGGVPQSALETDLEEAASRWRRRCTRGRT